MDSDTRQALAQEREDLLNRLREVESQLDSDGRLGLATANVASWQRLLDALPAQVALLDPTGRVVVLNQPWRQFAAATGEATPGARDPYAILPGLSARHDPGDGVAAAEAGIRAVLDGQVPAFSLDYPCATPQGPGWHRVKVTPVDPQQRLGCVVMHVDITEQKLAEESLRLNEARLRTILDAEPECVKVVSADGRLLSMNPAGLRMIDATSFGQVAGRPVRDLIHPDDRDAFLTLHRHVIAGNTGQLQFRIIGMQGEQRWMETHSVPLRDENGNVESVLSVTRDVNARRETEERLAALQRLNQHILDSVGEGIQGVDMDGRISFANPAAEHILGWGEAEMVGAFAHEQNHHSYADGRPYHPDECPIHLTLADGVPRRVDHEVFFHRDGRAIPVEYVVTPVRDSDGAESGVVICFRDISERVANLAALARTEARFRLVAKVTLHAIWDWDLTTDSVVWSGRLEWLFGYHESEVQAQPDFWTTRIHPDDRERVLADLDACVRGNTDSWELEYSFRRCDDSYATVVDRGVVVRDEGGRAVRMVGGMSDVSGMRTLEAKLRASQRLEAVGQLTGGLAHDFNNLLTVVLGNAELLQESLPPTSTAHELARMIMTAAERGSSLTQRLLAFARRQALEARTVRLGELVGGMEHLVRRALGEQIALTIASGPDDAWVVVDPAQLENALLNLCINARDAMPGGGDLAIEVSAVRLAPPDVDPLSRSQPGRYVCLEVRDSGCGIADDILPLIIEPFFTTKETGKGTGLGLSMVYGLVKQSNGYLDIRSTPGQGTSVRIHLPQASALGGGDTLPVSPATADGGSEHILLVEDDALVRRYVASQLGALGYRVTTAEGGAQALQLLTRDGTIDLMLTDVMMPGMNGAELAEAARGLRPALPILFSSGYSEDTLASEGRLPPGVLLLAKPYHKAELARRVRQALA